MSDIPLIQTNNLHQTFRSLQSKDPKKVSQNIAAKSPDYKMIPRNNYAPSATVNTGEWGNGRGINKYANSNVIYGQPQFFSPVHTPINWQIPSKRLEVYQWSRFFYSNEPKVAAAIDFYSEYPMSNWTHECGDHDIKLYFDKMKRRLKLNLWAKMISHEVHLLGDCFPLAEIQCPSCHGSGKIGDEICDHAGGTIKRIVILNPDYVEVEASPFNPEPLILLRPNEELVNMVHRKVPGHEKLHPDVLKLIAAGQSIRLDNRNVAHLKYGETGYDTFGTGMVRRLFPTLSYKTKLMVAQWIVAERLIVPIKIVKVGSDERPAGPADIAAVQEQLSQTQNDPNLTIITHHAFDLEWKGASGSVLALSNEFELINQEILDGMMINNALLNGEGPTHQSAAIGVESMIRRLESFREKITDWLIDSIYLPEAKRQGFIRKNPETGTEEYMIPKIKWAPMHLRDKQQDRQFALQLYEKGLLSAQTVLEMFDYDADQEIERKRYDAVQMMALGQGAGDDMGGGFGGGGMDLGGGGLDLGGGGEEGGMDLGGGDAPIEAGGDGPPIAKSSTLSQAADPSQYGGKVLKKKNRERIESEKQKMFNAQNVSSTEKGGDGYHRVDGTIAFTGPERKLIDHIQRYQQDGIIKYPVVPQYKVKIGTSTYPIDFALPHLKIGVEADGEIFHSSPKQVKHDKERDAKLNQAGWTIIRFTEVEIEHQSQQMMSKIVKTIMQKEMMVKDQAPDRAKE